MLISSDYLLLFFLKIFGCVYLPERLKLLERPPKYRKDQRIYSWTTLCTRDKTNQGSRSPDFGTEIRPHSQWQKVCFFPNYRQKIPNLKKKKKKIFFWFSIFKYRTYCYIIIISHTNNFIIYIKKKGKFIIGINLAMETSYIRTMSNFPILVKTPLILPIPWAPAQFPKRGVRVLRT